MEFPANAITRLTERIMADIHPHLQPDNDPAIRLATHYNSTYEIVHRHLSQAAAVAQQALSILNPGMKP